MNLVKEFKFIVKDLKKYLKYIKNDFDKYDRDHHIEKEKILYLNSKKNAIFKQLDTYFAKLQKLIELISINTYSTYQKYIQKELWPLLRYPIETNRLICEKPFGYSGDFNIINYIYDYHKDYLGSSLYEKLINNYTCNIPISSSVVKRKDFFRQKIEKITNSKRNCSVLSIGSGSARELTELLSSQKIKTQLRFDCLDFEKKALQHIANEFKKVPINNMENLHLKFIDKNIIELIRNKHLQESLDKYDLIYSAGLFDYLSDKIARKIIKNLIGFTKENGNIIITNASEKKKSHIAYYEMLGEWYLKYRTKNMMNNWLDNIRNINSKFELPDKANSFLYLNITHI